MSSTARPGRVAVIGAGPAGMAAALSLHQAGRALAFSDARIMAGHILPNIFPEILVMASLWLAINTMFCWRCIAAASAASLAGLRGS